MNIYETKCLTFYSYKGGSGRSTTAINTTKHLIEKMKADKNHPILLVDADLESAGLTFFFQQKDKFSDAFSHRQSLHTGLILSGDAEPGDFFERKESFSPPNKSLRDAIKEIVAMEGYGFLEDMLKNILLPLQDGNILAGILQKYITSQRTLEINSVTERYNPRPLFGKLMDTYENSSLTDEEKRNVAYRHIKEFIPTREYTDISEFFGAEAGTVRFLGADAGVETKQIARNDVAIMQINKLKKECSRRNYAAIVFDSGSGTQSSAHVFHAISDVLVYCMRPTMQFAEGTFTNLCQYAQTLRTVKNEKRGEDSTKKSVILLPTAVPIATQYLPLSEGSFAQIRYIAASFEDLIDSTFCTRENALCEVELFKWREQILGVADAHKGISAEIKEIASRYSNPSTMPMDAQRAYSVYGELARCIINNFED